MFPTAPNKWEHESQNNLQLCCQQHSHEHHHSEVVNNVQASPKGSPTTSRGTGGCAFPLPVSFGPKTIPYGRTPPAIVPLRRTHHDLQQAGGC